MSVERGWQRVVAEIGAVRTRQGRSRIGCCWIEGTRVFERALRAGARIERAVTSRAFLADAAPRTRALRDALEAHGCALEVVPDEVLLSLTEGRSLGGLVGLARCPEPPDLAGVLAGSDGGAPVLLGCVDLQDPGNVGALVRTAHASGALALLAVGSCDALHPKAVRTSMGSVFRLPVIERRDLQGLLSELADLGVGTLGAVSTDGIPLPRLERGGGPVAVFLGSEAFGLGARQRSLFDRLVTIPMGGGVDSFSVNAAAAILLHELGRGRCSG